MYVSCVSRVALPLRLLPLSASVQRRRTLCCAIAIFYTPRSQLATARGIGLALTKIDGTHRSASPPILSTPPTPASSASNSVFVYVQVEVSTAYQLPLAM